MARSVSACALYGLLILQISSLGCSPSSGSTSSAPSNLGGRGNAGSTSHVGGTTSHNTNAAGGAFQVTPVSTDALAGLKKTCGDSKADPNEKCDDGNKTGGDGCSVTCQLENPNEWNCPPTGACTSLAVCGDGKLSSREACDDSNQNGGDGCSADCQTIDDGWQCRVPGKDCVPICGDSVIIDGHEECDDGNTDNSDGCSASCLQEPGWTCTGTGPGKCKKSVCGDGVQDANEKCDKGDDNGLFYGDGSGCSKTCTQEPICHDASGKRSACSEVCGDGNKSPNEACDDGNIVGGDGCSADCKTVSGDGNPESGYTCTDVTLKDEQDCPSASGLKCLVLPVIYRDFEGQNVKGGHPDFFYMGAAVDTSYGGTKRTVGVTGGASKTTCMPNAYGTQLAFTPGANGICPANDQSGPCTGLVADSLDADGKPVMGKKQCHCIFTDWDNTGVLGACSGASCTATAGLTGVQTCYVKDSGDNHLRMEADVDVFQSADSFKQWYRDSDYSNNVHGSLELAATSGGLYQFSSSRPGDPAGSASRIRNDDLHDACLATPHSVTLDTGFFPLEDQSGATKVCNITSYWISGLSTSASTCCAGTGCPVKAQYDPAASWDNCPTAGTGGMVPKSDGTGGKITGKLRNFYFTSEVRYLFRYDGKSSTLSFNGDDDVWVFINGKLAIDLGGTHERASQSVSISGATYGLTAGNTYEIAVFQAERGPVESNYQLTLFGFSTTKTQCKPTCGNGIKTMGEECDDGDKNSDDAYNGCTTDCKYGPFCGDGEQNGDEACDHGRENGATYGKEGCTGDCQTPHYCGDGFIDGLNGEECDDKGPTSTCDKDCKVIYGPIN